MAATLVLVFVVVLIIAGALVVNAFRDSDDSAAPASEEPSAPERDASGEPAADPSEESSADEAPEEVLNSGWKLAKVGRWELTYEIPGRSEGWTYEGPGAVFGVGPPDAEQPELTMVGASYYGTNPCDGSSSLAAAGAHGVENTEDTGETAEGVARKWAELAYEYETGAPEVELRSVTEFSANGLAGHYAVADATPVTAGGECIPESGEVHTVVVPNLDEANAVRAFSIVSDSGYEESLDADTIETVLNSLRDSVDD
ncbi:hypothetical protein EFW17_08555 [Halostreptopolyspora alba]|uniref:DUF8017 domain-containing protein n=2 Tax=Halostreptopolyspora alba TaxID=2487137 RepID=A0A3N0ECG7_9ACTN|nr:hypothetical protein EFW17_08555 [Nocardiopsaceae bacterium YIM 96095]